MPMPLNPPSDDQVRQQVLAQLLADDTTRSGPSAAGLLQPLQQATLGAVRMGDNEDAAWAGGYRNDEVRKGNDQMLELVAQAMQAQRDQTAADKLALAHHAGAKRRRGGAAASAYVAPSGLPAPTLTQLSDGVGAGVISAPPALPPRITGTIALKGPGTTMPAGPAGVVAAKAGETPQAVNATKKWMGW